MFQYSRVHSIGVCSNPGTASGGNLMVIFLGKPDPKGLKRCSASRRVQVHFLRGGTRLTVTRYDDDTRV